MSDRALAVTDDAGSLPPLEVEWHLVRAGDAPWVQLEERFALAVLPAASWRSTSLADRRQLVHALAAHLLPGGRVLLGDDGRGRAAVELAPHLTACGLDAAEPSLTGWLATGRSTRRTVHDLVADARSGLTRVTPADLAAAGDHYLVVDIRTPTDRHRRGVIPGSVHVPRTTLEWRCDPASGFAHDRITGFDQRIVVVCNDGYSSSLAAASLQALGFVHATDLVGGITGWQMAGFPTVPPDHTAL